MIPVTILTSKKLSDLLTTGNALAEEITALATANNLNIPSITPAQVVLSSATPDMGDRNIQLMYPRICLYSSNIRNSQFEKFRSLSGTASVTADVWASANLVSDVDTWIHFYVEAMTGILRQNIGDWGDGVFFSGLYDAQFQPPKAGGIGFVQSAKVSCSVNVSR